MAKPCPDPGGRSLNEVPRAVNVTAYTEREARIVARGSNRPNKKKNTRRRNTPYKTYPRKRFTSPAVIVEPPRVASRIYRYNTVSLHAVATCHIGTGDGVQYYKVRFTGDVDKAFELRRGDRVTFDDVVFWGPERMAGHQEIHVSRFTCLAADTSDDIDTSNTTNQETVEEEENRGNHVA